MAPRLYGAGSCPARPWRPGPCRPGGVPCGSPRIPGPEFAGTGSPGRPPGFPSARSRSGSRWTTGSGSRRRCTSRMGPATAVPRRPGVDPVPQGRLDAVARLAAPRRVRRGRLRELPARRARHRQLRGHRRPASTPSARSSTTWRSSTGWPRETGAPARVGMFGISWGGFSALQAAARRPPALRAIIPVHFSHDRYNVDVHYVGGTLHVGESAYWPVEMVGENALPPDPERFGPGWREEWLRRLEATPQWPLELAAPPAPRSRTGGHGSAIEDWGAIEAPVLAIGGLDDGYRDAVLAVLEHVRAPRRGVIGPWGHAWPHGGSPGPSIDGVGLMRGWWDRWLKGEAAAGEDEPMLSLYVVDPPGTDEFPRRSAGALVAHRALAAAAPSRTTARALPPGGWRGGPRLAGRRPRRARRRPASTWAGPPDVGLAAPFWCGTATRRRGFPATSVPTTRGRSCTPRLHSSGRSWSPGLRGRDSGFRRIARSRRSPCVSRPWPRTDAPRSSPGRCAT